MNILVFGRSGQLGQELQRHARGHALKALGREAADFQDPQGCAAHVANTDADAVIIAAAYTDVDRAEAEEDVAMRVNATTPGAIARAAADRKIPLIHISTDYVFHGSGEDAFRPCDAPGPLGAYGRTKRYGEEAVRAAGGTHAIIRTSWVVSSHGGNFVKTMLRLGAKQSRLSVVADQVGGPTCASDIAGLCLDVAMQLANDAEKSGTYHFSGSPDVSRADFAREIFRQSSVDCEVVDIRSADYPTPARRPMNSRLDNSTTTRVFGIVRPDWRVGLGDILKDLGVNRS